MGTTVEKLIYLQETKEAIKNAIVEKGVEVPEGTTFRGYAEKVGEIPTGVTTEWKKISVKGNSSGKFEIFNIEIPIESQDQNVFIYYLNTNAMFCIGISTKDYGLGGKNDRLAAEYGFSFIERSAENVKFKMEVMYGSLGTAEFYYMVV